MARFAKLGCKFYLFGDYDGQFEAFVDRWDVKPGTHVRLVHEMAAAVQINLTKYRRGEDPELFNWFYGMYGQENATELAAESRSRYPADCDPTADPLVLCISHRKRMRVNRKQNELLRPSGAVYLEWSGEPLKGTTMDPQSMYIWEGLELIACPRGSGRQDVVQGVMYIVQAITEDHVELKMRAEYCRGAPDDTVKLQRSEVVRQLRLSHAMCYYTVQGRTVRDKHILLLDTDHTHFSVRALIVGLSRATHGKWLHIGDNSSEQAFVGPWSR